MADDDFELWLGRIPKDRPFHHSVLKSANLGGGLKRLGTRARKFDGSRIGRGSGMGRVLGASGRHSGDRSRRAIVKARIVRLAGKGARAAVAHLRYLQRDGTTREGERGSLYSAELDAADGKAFLERGSEDRHQFRFIVAPEDAAEYQDLKPLIRRLMIQAENDLGTKLDWVAVDHFNTGHPHTHILVRGKDDQGKDLIIAREYITKGLRQRAVDLVNLDLGPRTDREIMRSNLREIGQERFTGIDRRLLRALDGEGLVSPRHRDGVEQSMRAGRLATLARMGLANEEQRGRWRLAENLEPTLRTMGRRGDIIATLDREVRSRALAVSPMDYAVYEPADKQAQPIVGQVLTRGLSDDETDREYLIVDAIDGRTHYVEIGEGLGADMSIREGAIVRISPTPVEARDVDRTVAAIAARNGGRYSEDIHLLDDPTASERFVRAHVRRLEALRRGKAGVEREADGSWKIAPDHVGRAQQYERVRAAREPVRVDILSALRLEEMPNHNGITWLDEDASLSQRGRLGGGFGAKVTEALRQRKQWLVEQGLSEQPDMLEKLRTRELQRIARQLSRELGLGYAEAAPGDAIEGIYRRPVQVGSARMALIENSREFTLVPWRPVLERRIGREVSGVMRGRDVSWTFGRERSGPEIG
ncbi:MAG TPA: relaxase/mobilization nuclease RlxS [Sphingomicrobium sp.]|nr:relaxase/mobilization nuclease RlxS [Sphingomicrobium sp.]